MFCKTRWLTLSPETREHTHVHSKEEDVNINVSKPLIQKLRGLVFYNVSKGEGNQRACLLQRPQKGPAKVGVPVKIEQNVSEKLGVI